MSTLDPDANPDLVKLKKMALEEGGFDDPVVAMHAFCVLIGELRSIRRTLSGMYESLHSIKNEIRDK